MQKTIEDCGLPFRTEEQIKATIGIRLEEIPLILWPSFNGLKEKFVSTYRKNFEEKKGQIPVILFRGVKDTLVKLNERGIKMAIATSRSHKSVRELTEQLGIKDYFVYLLGGDDVSEGKPNPESIYKISSDMNWKPDETLMVGDMNVDIMMGKNAGVRTCAVNYGNGKQTELLEAGADHIIDSFSLLPEILKTR